MVRLILISLASIVTLAGCAAGPQRQAIEHRIKVPETLPEKLIDQGLLVATIAGNAVSSTVVEQVSFSFAGIQIDNTYYTDAVRNNYLVLPLKPGEYTLDSIHAFKSTEGGATRYPMNYKFRIVSGQATNLGVITLVRDTRKQATASSTDKPFLRALVKNTDEMTDHLRKRHPKLFASLTPATPVPAGEVKYANDNQIEALRREISRDAWLWTDEPALVRYVGGELGTVAKLLRNTRGKVAAIDVLDSGTTVAMRSCSGHDDRFVCSSPEPMLYSVRDNKVERRKLPVPAEHVWVHTFPPRGLVLVDQNMNIYLSKDDGASWSKTVWYPIKKALGPASRIKFTNGKNGYYIYSAYTVDPLAPEVIYSEYDRAGFRKVEIPKMKYWQRLVETPDGLLVGPQNSESTSDTARLYFRPASQTEWQARPLPGKRCFFLRRAAENSPRLVIQCDGKQHNSMNSGATWSEGSGSEQ